MSLFYVLSFFKKGDTIQGGTLFKEIRYSCFFKLLARLIPQDLFIFFQTFGPAFSRFFKLLARLIPQDLFMFFQTFGPIYSTRLIKVIKLLVRLIHLFFKNYQCNLICAVYKKISRTEHSREMLPFDNFFNKMGI